MSATDVLTQGLVDDITAVARAVPGVQETAVVIRKAVRAAAPPAIARPVETAEDVDAPPAELDGGELHIPDGAPRTLQEALRAAAETAPGKGTIYVRRDREDELQTYASLLEEAERVLAGLRSLGLQPGDPALFQCHDNRDYLTAFWACVLGGFVPTPVAVATTYQSPNETNRKLRNAWHLLGRPVLITDDATVNSLVGVRQLWNEPDVRIATVSELSVGRRDTAWHPTTVDSPVLNLLTSGSTGVPKCVQHTNASVAARTLAVSQHCGLGSDDVSLIWMPFDHVTVAMYNVRDVFLQCMHVNAKTEHFLADPLLWLDWVHRYRATNTWAPNFAFSLVNEYAEAIRSRSWDLSCLREITNAGEPVIAATSRRFLELLAPHGLAPDVMRPAWGMSETCSGVTYARQHRDDPTAGTVTVDPSSLAGVVRPADEQAANGVVLSTVGRPIPGVRIRVVDDTGKVLPEGRIGELRITGGTMMNGYYANDEANRDAYDGDRWFRTGDLAFVRDGELVIAGRSKDQIIVRGINYMAHELESVVERVDGVRVTYVAAASTRRPEADSDQLVIFFVSVTWDAEALARTAEQIRATLVREVGIAPDVLVPVAEEEFPKTDSGKIQRSALVAELNAGTFADRLIGAEPNSPSDTWLVRRQWVAAPPDPARDDGLGVRLAIAEEGVHRQLGLDGHVVVVPGDGCTEETPYRFRAAVDDPDALLRLFRTVTERHGRLSTVVLATPLSLTGDPASRLAASTAQFAAVIAAFAAGGFKDVQMLVLTVGSLWVRPGDRVDLGTCALPALVRTAASETTSLTLRQLDLPPDTGEWAQAVRAELCTGGPASLVAAREGGRWQPRLCPVPENVATGTAGQPVTTGGLYLVTGGLGGIAHELAGYLVASYGIKLLVVGRSPAEGERADRLAELAGMGDAVYHRLDVADGEALEAAVRAAELRRERPLDGVFHLAAADPTAQWNDLERHMIANESRGTFAEQFRAKVAGTLAIAEVLESRPDADLVLFGSVNGEFGGHSFGAYSVANSFLAGFADHWHHERGRRVRCLAWSAWTGVGMNRECPTAAAQHRGFRPIAPELGLRLFLTAMAAPHHYLLIGLDLTNPAITNDLVPDRMRVSEVLVAYTGEHVEPAELAAAVAETARGCPFPVRPMQVPRIPRNASGEVDEVQLLFDTVPERSRPQINPPATDLEHELAEVWSRALQRPIVGRDESFFELGGNSLLATRLLASIEVRLAVRVPVYELYESPTVAGMAAAVERHRISTP